jgi:EAL domain
VLPFVRPDLIKLDMRLLQGRTTAEAAHIVNTVRAQAERADAVVIAEGIETIKHAREAAAAGAIIGQGFLFGYPAPLPSEMPPPTEAIPLRKAQAATGDATPWEVVAPARGARRTTKGEWDLIVIGPRFAAPTTSAATTSWSPTTASWSSGPPSRCCAGWCPSTDRRGIVRAWVV